MKVSLIAAALLMATASSALAATRIVVLPFAGITPEPLRDRWMGPAVQQNMILALDQAHDVSTVSYPGKIEGVVDGGVASRAARATQSDLAIIGTYEVVDGKIRLTAQVVDGNTGVALSTAQVTGPATELLSLEDQLSDRTRTALGAPVAETPPILSAEVPPPAPTGAGNYDPLGFGGAGYDNGSETFLGFYGVPQAVCPGGGEHQHGHHHHISNDGLSFQIFGDNWRLSFGNSDGRKPDGPWWQTSAAGTDHWQRHFAAEPSVGNGQLIVAPVNPVSVPMSPSVRTLTLPPRIFSPVPTRSGALTPGHGFTKAW